MSRYWLPKHVFLCQCGDQIILLDLKRDRYLALEAAHSRQLAKVVHDWPIRGDSAADSQATVESTAEPLAQKMVDKGLLSDEKQTGRNEPHPVCVSAASSTLVQPTPLFADDEPRDTGLPIRAHHMSALVLSTAVAAAKLRWRPLERVVSDVSRRRIRHSRPSTPSANVELAQQLVAIFRRLRPYVFTAHSKCLLDSLTLLNFLSHYRLFPHWVFGVRTAPFAAHCWVQLGDTVYNDSVDHVSLYTPIMIA